MFDIKFGMSAIMEDYEDFAGCKVEVYFSIKITHRDFFFKLVVSMVQFAH